MVQGREVVGTKPNTRRRKNGAVMLKKRTGKALKKPPSIHSKMPYNLHRETGFGTTKHTNSYVRMYSPYY